MVDAVPPDPPASDADPARTALALDNQLCFAVYSTAHAFNRLYKPLLDRLGLTYPQYLVMLVLWAEDDQTVGAIGERLMLETSTLTPLLQRIERAGLIVRRRGAADSRQVRVALTEAGRALADRAGQVPLHVFAATGCPVDELRALRTALGQLRDRLVAAAEALPG
jgi:DNA-binding MarR family transcriptional regulator